MQYRRLGGDRPGIQSQWRQIRRHRNRDSQSRNGQGNDRSPKVGGRYTLSFYVGQEAVGPITGTVSLGGTTLTTTTVSTAGWTAAPVAVTFTATAPESGGLLSFAATTPSGGPPIALLDGVSITAVPEPDSITLLGLGGLVMVGLRRRRARLPA